MHLHVCRTMCREQYFHGQYQNPVGMDNEDLEGILLRSFAKRDIEMAGKVPPWAVTESCENGHEYV